MATWSAWPRRACSRPEGASAPPFLLRPCGLRIVRGRKAVASVKAKRRPNCPRKLSAVSADSLRGHSGSTAPAPKQVLGRQTYRQRPGTRLALHPGGCVEAGESMLRTSATVGGVTLSGVAPRGAGALPVAAAGHRHDRVRAHRVLRLARAYLTRSMLGLALGKYVTGSPTSPYENGVQATVRVIILNRGRG